MKPVKVKQQKMKGNEWAEEEIEIVFPSLCKLFGYA